jgi:hypothetical protein
MPSRKATGTRRYKGSGERGLKGLKDVSWIERLEREKMQSVYKCALVLTFSVIGLWAQELTVVSFPHQGVPIAHDSTYPGIAATSVTMAPGKYNATPCFNCVPGVTGSVSLDDPRYLVDWKDHPLVEALLIEDTDYTGPCNAVLELLQNGQRPQLSWGPIFGGCAAGMDYIVSWSGGGSSYSNAPAVLRGGVGIVPGSMVSVVEVNLQFHENPPPAGMIGPATITIGIPVAGLPCSDCASMPTPNLSIPTPLFAVPRDQALMVTLGIEDVSYDGQCTFFYQIKQGSTVVANGGHIPSGGCSAGTLKLPTWDVTIPQDTPTGPATLLGGVVAGSQTYSIYQPILIQ